MITRNFVEYFKEYSIIEEFLQDFNSIYNNVKKWSKRWLMSTNHKDIGTLYIIFGAFSGIVGTIFSVVIRLELAGFQTILSMNAQLYNVIITGHAFLMIFFL